MIRWNWQGLPGEDGLLCVQDVHITPPHPFLVVSW